jgi:RimJ/RimL family protein N-acetyltransferase
MFAAAADLEIWALHPVSNRHTESVFRTFFDGAIASGSAFSFVDRQRGKIIGSSRYYAYDPAANEIEIGWTFLARAYWGGSHNLEIKRLMLAHAFRFVDTVVFGSAIRTGGRSVPWRRSAVCDAVNSSPAFSPAKFTRMSCSK